MAQFASTVERNAAIESGGNLATLTTTIATLFVLQKNLLNVMLQILVELQLHTAQLQTGLTLKDDLDALRSDLASSVLSNALVTGVIDAY